MAVIVETGAGIRSANSYVTVAFVTAYLTTRNRNTAWDALTTAVQEAAVVAATDYVDKRFGPRVKGIREFEFDAVYATATVTFTGLPSDSETLTIGETTYTFVSSLSGAADEILIGASASATAANLAAAIDLDAGAGTSYGTGTTANRSATAVADGAVVTLTAQADGQGGNDTVLSGSPTNVTVGSFSGGLDGGSQPLELPRTGLYDLSGRPVSGIPRAWKEAVAEYADRASTATLAPDPSVDDRGAAIVGLREKVGPIETETTYQEGSHQAFVFRPYPAADELLRPYLLPPGGTFR